MAKTTITIHKCDMCGYETKNTDQYIDGERGELTVAYKGSIGQDCGGVNIQECKWLCLRCTKKFIDFMESASNEHRTIHREKPARKTARYRQRGYRGSTATLQAVPQRYREVI